MIWWNKYELTLGTRFMRFLKFVRFPRTSIFLERSSTFFICVVPIFMHANFHCFSRSFKILRITLNIGIIMKSISQSRVLHSVLQNKLIKFHRNQTRLCHINTKLNSWKVIYNPTSTMFTLENGNDTKMARNIKYGARVLIKAYCISHFCSLGDDSEILPTLVMEDLKAYDNPDGWSLEAKVTW